mmetsp:Transcript_29386/g.56417  ORF Transcript_29386/g.56417 Transcript_29386/m.56417 type:complete len:178 (-) Transcript_29386:216-749(-)|eukprot:CAMPEP_0114250370 /NCGR_PEP_ID=MMETSP0058-20121206/14661_1 /TAXON_ID=36894 /ORGANISM="Pyramimonas parkeae, CCMP726" /LENGTH=177 /DNA_ID=CAMNT_0001364021 /DNA_START=98 /DNA_END=631 /DNA_ORIENTATION=+
MTKFHVTLNGVGDKKKSDVLSRLGTNKSGSGINKAGGSGSRPSLNERWQHDMFNAREQAPGPAASSSLSSNDLRWQLSGDNQTVKRKGRGSVKSRLGIPLRKVATGNSTRGNDMQVRGNGADAGIATLLNSLGLDKYRSLFAREEVDIDALTCMSEKDLTALGIPMGPRKKLLAALR